jgi:hypothetical protein
MATDLCRDWVAAVICCRVVESLCCGCCCHSQHDTGDCENGEQQRTVCRKENCDTLLQWAAALYAAVLVAQGSGACLPVALQCCGVHVGAEGMQWLAGRAK